VKGAWPVEVLRAAERAAMATVPSGALMQRAAAGLAAECARLLRPAVYGAPVALLVGAGDNGGDALYAGARLARRGAAVTAVLLAPERAHAGGLAALTAAGGRTIAAGPTGDPGTGPAGASAPDAVAAVRGARLVLDGIVGLGAAGPLRPAAAALVAEITGVVVAVDLPSGVHPDTGEVAGAAVRADLTVTFGGLKTGLLAGAGAERAGEVRLVDIGLRLPEPDLRVLEPADVAALVPAPGPTDDKYTRGVAGVAAGSATYPGAGVLCTGAAVRGGAGMVRYAGSAAEHVRSRWPEAIVTDARPSDAGRVQAWVVGPGIGTDDAAAGLLRDVLGQDVPVLVDADGLTLLAREPELLRRRGAPTVLTPHDREFERIAGPVGADRVGAARRAAAELGVTMLLKGNATVVAEPGGLAYVNPTGTPWLATAGSGDVLSGLGAALLAGGLAPGPAAAVAAYLHGLAGTLAAGGASTTAAGVLDALPAALRAARYLQRAARGGPEVGGPCRSGRCRPHRPGEQHTDRLLRRVGPAGGLRRLCEDGAHAAVGGGGRPRRHPGQRRGAPVPDPRRGDGGGQGRRVRPRAAPLGPRGPGRRRELAGRRVPGGGAEPAPGRHQRAGAVLARHAGGGPRRRRRRGRRPVSQRAVGGRRARRRRPGRRPARPGAPQDRHRAVPRRRHRGRLARAGHRRRQVRRGR